MRCPALQNLSWSWLSSSFITIYQIIFNFHINIAQFPLQSFKVLYDQSNPWMNYTLLSQQELVPLKCSILINKQQCLLNFWLNKTNYFKTCPRWIPLGYVIIWFQYGLYGKTREPNGNMETLAMYKSVLLGLTI